MKNVALVALAGLALTVAACGNDAAPPAAPTTSAIAPPAAPAVPAAPAATDATPTATATATTPSTTGSSVHAVTVVPLKLVTTPAGFTKHHFKTIELRADGTLVRDGKAYAQLTPDAVNTLDDKNVVNNGKSGKPMIAIGRDGTLTQSNGSLAQLTATDTLTNSVGESFNVADDGTVTFVRKSGEKVTVDAKFESIPANGKPAAQLLIASSFLGLGLWKNPKP
jgi:hypothetical protein